MIAAKKKAVHDYGFSHCPVEPGAPILHPSPWAGLPGIGKRSCPAGKKEHQQGSYSEPEHQAHHTWHGAKCLEEKQGALQLL